MLRIVEFSFSSLALTNSTALGKLDFSRFIMASKWHETVDKCINVEESGCVDFKLLRELLHDILRKLDEKTPNEVENDVHHPEIISEDSKRESKLEQGAESLHDSMSRLLPEQILGESHQRLERKVSIIEESICATTDTLNNIIREFQKVQQQITGNASEVGDLKESLDAMRHHLMMTTELEGIPKEIGCYEVQESSKGM